MLKPSAHRSKQRFGTHIFQQLLHRYPLAFWGGLWATLVTVAAMAVLNLLSPGQLSQDQAKPKPAAIIIKKSVQSTPDSTQVPTARHRDIDIPLSLFGAIALTCAGGSLLIVAQFKLAKYHNKIKRAKTVAVRNKKPSKTVKKSSVAQKRLLNTKTKQSVPQRQVKQAPIVTILPPEVSVSDWVEEPDPTLAEMMDIRKQHSLSSLLRDR